MTLKVFLELNWIYSSIYSIIPNTIYECFNCGRSEYKVDIYGIVKSTRLLVMQVTFASIRRKTDYAPGNLNPLLSNIKWLCRTGRKGHRNSGDIIPDSKIHGANMGSIWGRQDPGGPHVGPMIFAIWVSSTRYLGDFKYPFMTEHFQWFYLYEVFN